MSSVIKSVLPPVVADAIIAGIDLAWNQHNTGKDSTINPAKLLSSKSAIIASSKGSDVTSER